MHSFKAPLYGAIPDWVSNGNTIILTDAVRLTGEEQSQRGGVWNLSPILADDFEVVLDLAIGGSGRLGADGLAIWFTENMLKEGNAFGNENPWKGVGVFFDTFDNDGKNDNPSIYGLLNDGQVYDTSTDGSRVMNPSMNIGYCRSAFRTRSTAGSPGAGFKVLVRYQNQKFSVYYDTTKANSRGGRAKNATPRWKICFTSNDLELPSKTFLGLTAETGGIHDIHEVSSVQFFDLSPISEYDKLANEDAERVEEPPAAAGNEEEEPAATRQEDEKDAEIRRLREQLASQAGAGDPPVKDVEVPAAQEQDQDQEGDPADPMQAILDKRRKRKEAQVAAAEKRKAEEKGEDIGTDAEEEEEEEADDLTLLIERIEDLEESLTVSLQKNFKGGQTLQKHLKIIRDDIKKDFDEVDKDVLTFKADVATMRKELKSFITLFSDKLKSMTESMETMKRSVGRLNRDNDYNDLNDKRAYGDVKELIRETTSTSNTGIFILIGLCVVLLIAVIFFYRKWSSQQSKQHFF